MVTLEMTEEQAEDVMMACRLGQRTGIGMGDNLKDVAAALEAYFRQEPPLEPAPVVEEKVAGYKTTGSGA